MDQNSNYLVKTECNLTLNFENWCTLVRIRANLEVDTSQKLKFSKSYLTLQFHLFFWLKNLPCFNFWVKIDGFADTCFLHLLRPLALRFCKIGRNHSASMNKYLKDNLILGDSLEMFFGWITLTDTLQHIRWFESLD